MEFAMITLFWLFIAAMALSSLAMIALTIADVFDAHKSSQADRRLTPKAGNAFGAAGGVLVWQTHLEFSRRHRKSQHPRTKTLRSKSVVAPTNFMNYEDRRMGAT
jgi:hypothetical protein